MLIPIAHDTAKTETSGKGTPMLPDADTSAEGDFIQILDEKGKPVVELVAPPADLNPEPEGEEEAPKTSVEPGEDTIELALGEAPIVTKPQPNRRLGPGQETVHSHRAAPDPGGPAAPQLAASDEPHVRAPVAQDIAIDRRGIPNTAPLIRNPETPSPTAIGSKGPNPHPTQAEDPDMQLTRPTRLRSFSPAVTRTVAAQGSVPPVAEDAPVSPLPIKAVSPTIGTDDSADNAPRQQTSRWPMTAEQRSHAQTSVPPAPTAAQTTPHPVTVTGAAQLARLMQSPRAEQLPQTNTTAELRPLNATPLNPQVLAAYTSLTTRGTPSTEAKPLRSDEIAAEVSIARSAETPGSTDLGKAAPRAGMPTISPEQLASQLTQIAQNAALQRRDILLNPEELGRIRMNVNAQDQAVHVAILVERPETLDLMRRYISQLTQDFRNLGYQDVSFDFAQQQRDGTQADPSQSQATEPEIATETTTEPVALPPQRAQPTGLLDLRI